MVYSKTIEVVTKRSRQIIEITSEVAKAASDSGIRDGMVLVFTRHTTTGLFINERESGLIEDMETVLCNLVPLSGEYLHDRVDDNAASHIQSVLLSPSVVVPLGRGELELGTWQSILFAELDGPRTRSVIIRVVGDQA